MATIPTITINTDEKCFECGKDGRTGNGVCLGCTTKAIQGKPMRSVAGRAVAARMREMKSR